jgi:phospholipase C
LRDRLDAAHVSWKYYVPKMCCRIFGKLMSAFDAIKAVRYGRQWNDGHIARPQTRFFDDVRRGALPAVSWLIPIERDSDHPGTQSDTGPSWVATVVNAIGESRYWDSTAIVIVWDDWGGLYDNVNPQQVGFGGLGFRVPAIIVSAYAKTGYISTTRYEFGSILKYIERNWNLRTLGRSDVRAASIVDCFDYAQPPRTFHPIRAKYAASYFLRETSAAEPPDTDW